jgi:hypothetical protein
LTAKESRSGVFKRAARSTVFGRGARPKHKFGDRRWRL